MDSRLDGGRDKRGCWQVDVARTRWLAAGGGQGDVFLASGDGRRSVVWKLSPADKTWIVVREAKGPSRYQYLQVSPG